MVTSTRYSTDRYNKPDRLIGVSVDSTSCVQAEVSLHESERRFRAIFNSIFHFTGLLTTEGMVLEVNQTALDFGGSQPQDVVGRPYWEIWWAISEETQCQLKAAMALAAKGEFVRYEVDVISAEQTVRTTDFSLKLLTDETGKVVLPIFKGLDITDLKQAQTALQEAKQQLEIRLATNYCFTTNKWAAIVRIWRSLNRRRTAAASPANITANYKYYPPVLSFCHEIIKYKLR
ncbi:MAG: PAS domain-containing protein [Nostoc sp.]|uniref:PAS domain-containing protein n=1 Tax=Nostoc sp. TaxID=1180 RepID=UPI002FFB1F54